MRSLNWRGRPVGSTRRGTSVTPPAWAFTTSGPLGSARWPGRSRTRHEDWTVRDALTFADALIVDKHLEVKGLGIEVLARFRRQFTPALLPAWKRWLAKNHSANWATTDAICGLLIGPLVAAHPELASERGTLGRRSQHVGPPRRHRRPHPDRAARRRARHPVPNCAHAARRRGGLDPEGCRLGAARGGQGRHGSTRAVFAFERPTDPADDAAVCHRAVSAPPASRVVDRDPSRR